MLYENRGKRPRALLVKSENLITSQNRPKALLTLQQLMEFYSDSPLIYQARMLAAQAYGEEQRFDEASDMLLKNLYDGALSPDSSLWRDSLIELGGLLLKRGEILNLEAGKIRENKQGIDLEIERLTESQAHLRSSIDRFKDALMRFSDDPRSLRLQYNIAQAYRLAAALPKRLLDEELVEVETKRKRNVQQRRELLTSAMQHYISLRNKIQQQMDPLAVDPAKQNMLRNCFFGEADILFELGDYPAALNAYNAAATQYMNEPEVMESLLQKSRCHELMGNKKEARQVLLQAQQILKRIPVEKDAKFSQVTRYDREQWGKHLDWMLSIPTSTR
jgi:tetratricopeptide (TPR) repeat protein